MATNWKDGGDQKPVGMFSCNFPQGLRVLIVDDNPTCLRILERKLQNFEYEVTKCNRAEKALGLLRENKNRFDIVIIDVQMPDIDGFQFLLQVGSEIDLPIIVMSADDSVESVIEGMKNGACDYLIKPIRLEALKTIYKHVAKKALEQMTMSNLEENAENSSSVTETNQRDPNKRKSLEGDENNHDHNDDNDHISASKKPRVVWSVELHQQFVSAVNHLGLDKAVPKKILEIMNVPWLTRENVASHLQKYRMYLKKMSDHEDNMNGSFISPREASFCAVSSSPNGNGQTLSTTVYQGAANPNVTMAVYPRTRADGQLQQHLSSVAHMSLLNGFPMTPMEPKQLAGMNTLEDIHANLSANGQNQSHINTLLFSPTGQPVFPTRISSAISGRNGFPPLPLNHDISEFSGNNFHFGHAKENSIITNCDAEVDDAVLENLFPDKPADNWDLQDIDFSPLPESMESISQDLFSLDANGHLNACIQEKPMIFPLEQDMENRDMEEMSHHVSEQASLASARVKPEFPDLLNSFLDQHENVAMAGNGFGLDGYSIDNKLLSF